MMKKWIAYIFDEMKLWKLFLVSFIGTAIIGTLSLRHLMGNFEWIYVIVIAVISAISSLAVTTFAMGERIRAENIANRQAKRKAKELNYVIELKCWYQERPHEYSYENYLGKEFVHMQDAVEFLAENYEEIEEWFPVDEITIKPKIS